MKKNNPVHLFFIILFGTVALALFTGSNKRSDGDPGYLQRATTLSTKSEGLKAFYLLVKKWHPDIKRLTRPLNTLNPETAYNELLIIADPIKPLATLEDEHLYSWIQNGGTVILMTKKDWLMRDTGREDAKKEEMFLESYGLEITPEDPLRIYDAGQGIFIVSYDIFNNETLKNQPEKVTDIIEIILACPGTVYFDEYHLNLGQKDHLQVLLAGFLKGTQGHAVVYALVVFLTGYFFSRRSLFSEPEPEQKHYEMTSKQYILSRGAFLRSAGAEEFCKEAITNYNHYYHQRSHHDKSYPKKTIR